MNPRGHRHIFVGSKRHSPKAGLSKSIALLPTDRCCREWRSVQYNLYRAVSSKLPFSRISRDDAPTSTSKPLGSATHACFATL